MLLDALVSCRRSVGKIAQQRVAACPGDDRLGHQGLSVLMYTPARLFEHWGGGEVQLLKTAEYLRQLGVRVRVISGPDAGLARADWLHLFGTTRDCLVMARRAAAQGVRVALSTISWYEPWVSWRLEPSLHRRLRGVAAWWIRRVFPRVRSWRRELIQIADRLLPNSLAEARQLEQLFGADPAKIAIVFNGVDQRFEHGDPTLFRARLGIDECALVAGRIEPRKNQLAVIQSLRGSGIPLVVLGNAHPSHRAYNDACVQAAGKDVTFVSRLDHESPLLASVYATARVVVLASWFETPGLAALEGALAGANVVVTARGCAREYFGDAADYVEPDDLAGIRSATERAWHRPRNRSLQAAVRGRFLWSEVAKQTLAAYGGRGELAGSESGVGKGVWEVAG